MRTGEECRILSGRLEPRPQPRSVAASPCDVAFKRLLPRRSHHGGSGAAFTPANTPIARAAAAANRERSESLNSLFTSTSDDAPSVSGCLLVRRSKRQPPLRATVATATATTVARSVRRHAGAGAVKANLRSVTVLKPKHAEAERSRRPGGDVVVLALRNTPDNLSKRILDFSFGVSSALDASVDCVADKVFVISRGAALTDAERMSLRGQGVL